MASIQDKPAPGEVFACQGELLALFDTLVNVIFCIKDRQGRYVEVNSAFVRRTGKKSKREVIGTTAGDHFIAELAERYEEQDRQLFETGEPIRDQLELIRRTDGELGWYLTTKLPVTAERVEPVAVDGPPDIVGLASVSRDLLAPSARNIAIERLQDLVTHVRDNIGATIRVADLAEVAGCSEAQLERRMRTVFGVTATQYVLRVRVETAARLLIESDEPIATIAARCGFYDQPDFTRRFARLTNATPAQFRAAHRL